MNFDVKSSVYGICVPSANVSVPWPGGNVIACMQEASERPDWTSLTGAESSRLPFSVPVHVPFAS